MSNVNTLLGGAAADAITLGNQASASSVDLGAGADVLTFGNFANSATVSNTESISRRHRRGRHHDRHGGQQRQHRSRRR